MLLINQRRRTAFITIPKFYDVNKYDLMNHMDIMLVASVLMQMC